MSQVSILEKHRKQYQPKVPPSLRQGIAKVKVEKLDTNAQPAASVREGGQPANK